MPTTEFPPDPGGIATLAWEQASELARLGEQVRVEALAGRTDESLLPPPPGVEVLRQPVRQGPIWRLFPLTYALYRSARRYRPAFLHCPTYRGYGLPVMVVSRLLRIPYSIYLHGSELNTEQRSRARRRIMSVVLGGAAVVLTNSRNTLRLTSNLFPGTASRLEVVTPGVNAEKFQHPDAETKGRSLRQEWLARFAPPSAIVSGRTAAAASAQSAVIFLSLCRMVRAKGVHLVLEAFARLISRRPDLPVYYVAAGGGADLPFFQELASDLGIAERVLFPGPVAYSDTARHLKAADVYVQPSIPVGHFLESFGISFMEAQAGGLPCIGSDWGGVPEAVAPGETAFLIPPGDLDALVSAMEKLAGDQELRFQMGQNGMRRAAEMSWANHGSELSRLIRSRSGAKQ